MAVIIRRLLKSAIRMDGEFEALTHEWMQKEAIPGHGLVRKKGSILGSGLKRCCYHGKQA